MGDSQNPWIYLAETYHKDVELGHVPHAKDNDAYRIRTHNGIKAVYLQVNSRARNDVLRDWLPKIGLLRTGIGRESKPEDGSSAQILSYLNELVERDPVRVGEPASTAWFVVILAGTNTRSSWCLRI